jgi:HK97 family phage major capsid protein
MGVSTDVLGGYTVPEGFVMNLEYALRAYGGLRNVAEVLRTETAQPLPWPTIADTTPGSTDPIYGGSLINVGELLGENVATSLQGTPPAMGAVIFGAQKFSSKLIQISTELLRDSAFNLATYIGKIIGERLGRIIAQKIVTGSGGGIVPRGILNAVPTPPGSGSLGTGYTTASATGVTFDDLSSLIFSVDPAYRAAPGAGFCLHDKYVGMIRLLKDGVGRYLWSAGSVQTGMEPRIWSYPYQICQEYPYDLSGHVLDSTVSNGIGATTYLTKLMTFGDHSKYKIREVATVRMKRLVERFAEYDQDGFIGYMECDGDLVDAGTHPIGALALL